MLFDKFCIIIEKKIFSLKIIRVEKYIIEISKILSNLSSHI